MDIHISNNAADFIRQKLYNMPVQYTLRVYIKSIGCCSVDLGAAFDEIRSTDNNYTTKGIKIIIDKKMAKSIKGFRIDVAGGLFGAKLVVEDMYKGTC